MDRAGKQPVPSRRRRIEAAGALAGLALSLLALGAGPLLMPDSYSWLANTTSEAAAQGLEDAWLVRVGFLLFGWTVVWIVRLAGAQWGLLASLCFVAFGVLMTSAAAFSERAWMTSLPYDPTEDLLHSIAAGGIGFAFAGGVFFVAFRNGFDKPPRFFDAVAIIATILLPIGFTLFPDHDGLIQRGMFLIAYAWFTREILRTSGWLDPGDETRRTGERP